MGLWMVVARGGLGVLSGFLISLWYDCSCLFAVRFDCCDMNPSGSVGSGCVCVPLWTAGLWVMFVAFRLLGYRWVLVCECFGGCDWLWYCINIVSRRWGLGCVCVCVFGWVWFGFGLLAYLGWYARGGLGVAGGARLLGDSGFWY